MYVCIASRLLVVHQLCRCSHVLYVLLYGLNTYSQVSYRCVTCLRYMLVGNLYICV